MISILVSFLIQFANAELFYSTNAVPLSYSRVVNYAVVSGLAPKVVVQNASTNATLLASTTMPESASGSGVYTYVWTPSVGVDTPCVVTYTVGSQVFKEFLTIIVPPIQGRAF